MTQEVIELTAQLLPKFLTWADICFEDSLKSRNKEAYFLHIDLRDNNLRVGLHVKAFLFHTSLF